MNPNQPNPNQQGQNGNNGQPPAYPPYTQPQNNQPYSQQPQPYPNQQPQQPSQQPQPNIPDWHTPPPKRGESDNSPSNAGDYVNKYKQPTQNVDMFGQPLPETKSRSIDYLSKLSGSSSGGDTPKNQKMVLIGVGAFLALSLAIFLLIISSQGKNGISTPPGKLLYTSIASDYKVVQYEQSHGYIKNGELSNINSQFRGQLTNDLTALDSPLSKSGVSAKSIQNDIMKDKPFQKTIDKLKNAQLSATYDKVYARKMDFMLKEILMLMDKIQRVSPNKELVKFVKSDANNYKTIQDKLEEHRKTIENAGF